MTTDTGPHPTPPSIVIVGPFRYALVCDEAAINAVSYTEHSGLWGCCDHKQQQIILRPNLAADQLAETLLHEVLHAINQMTGLTARLDEAEEDIVRSTAPALLDVLRRNSDLIAYLTATTDG